MILICYDGSVDAKAAIEQAATLLPGQRVTVLTVWQPFVDVIARTPGGFGLTPGLPDPEEIDKLTRKSAEEQAREGAQLAAGAGLDAEPRIAAMQGASTAEAIQTEAEAVKASAIVIGSRGLTGLKSMLLGSVSHAVVQSAERPVIVVPSSEVSSARAHERAERAGN